MHRQPVAERPPRQIDRGPRTVLDVAAFDRACVARDLTRLVDGVPQPNNVKIAERLGLSHTTVGRARSGRPVGAQFIAAVCTHLSIPYEQVFKQNGAA